jgi:hypothetical protein
MIIPDPVPSPVHKREFSVWPSSRTDRLTLQFGIAARLAERGCEFSAAPGAGRRSPSCSHGPAVSHAFCVEGADVAGTDERNVDETVGDMGSFREMLLSDQREKAWRKRESASSSSPEGHASSPIAPR